MVKPIVLHILKQNSIKLGLKCKCEKTDFFWIKSRLSHECKSCKKRITLKSGTILENSNLSFLIWYKAMFLMSATKKGFSAREMQKQLGLKPYEPVWAMMHKTEKSYG